MNRMHQNAIMSVGLISLLAVIIIEVYTLSPRNEAILWHAQNIDSYHIEITEASRWHIQTYSITVRDGAVIDESAACVVAPLELEVCEVLPFNASAYTIEGLFARIDRYPTELLSVEFDPTYYFPSAIYFDDPHLIDEESALQITLFEPLP